MTTAKRLLIERKGDIVYVTINRPEALNALNTELLGLLNDALDELAASDARCVVVQGAGDRAFIAGADVAEMKDLTKKEALRFGRMGNLVFAKLSDLPMPVIAAIDGFCLGGGLEFALAADFRVASDNASFAFPETGLGIMPGFGGTARLPRLIGEAAAFDLIYTGRRIKADEALALGIVGRVFTASDFAEEVDKLAKTIAEKAPLAMRAAKRAIQQGQMKPLTDALFDESEIFAELFETSDQVTGMEALLSRTPHPGFKGQ